MRKLAKAAIYAPLVVLGGYTAYIIGEIAARHPAIGWAMMAGLALICGMGWGVWYLTTHSK